MGLGVTTWPLYATLGWGVGVLFTYLDAYGIFGKSLTEREFERLKAQR
ncbi:MAG: 2TM domain-containing protein [Gemmatimonadota bacterium]